MDTYNFKRNQPLAILASATGVAVCIAATLWGFSKIIPAFFAGIGLMAAAATSGFATAGAIASWIPAVAAIGIFSGGIAVTYRVIVVAIGSGAKRPYEWALPALTILSIFLVDMTKELIFPTQLERASFALITGLCTLAGGFLLLNKKMVVNIVGMILPFIPSIFIFSIYIQKKEGSLILKDIVTSGAIGQIGLIGAFAVPLLIIPLGLSMKK